jgi:hypothetical protein
MAFRGVRWCGVTFFNARLAGSALSLASENVTRARSHHCGATTKKLGYYENE